MIFGVNLKDCFMQILMYQESASMKYGVIQEKRK